MPEWKDTVNLPRTAFPMKANLATTEPQTIARWEASSLYGRIQAHRAGAPTFVLHDGPPYANGDIHIGHALNKILKDFIVKSRTMAGFQAPYVPGWDCHGLPIELKVDRELGSKKQAMSVADFRRACGKYAMKYVAKQREDFKRLAVFGTWDEPYLTMNYSYQSAIVRALGEFVSKGLVYKGKKPVHWCIHCRTALAEAEVEYESHTSPSIYVEFPLDPANADEIAARVPVLAGRDVSVLIWTTTPWTIPSNLAIAFHPDFVYGAYDVDGRILILAEGLAQKVGEATQRPLGAPVVTFNGATMEYLKFKHPLYDRPSLGVLADYVTLEAGTGAVHTAPGHGSDDFKTGVKYGLDVYAPVGPGGHYLDEVGLFGGQRVFDANPRVEEALRERGKLWYREAFDHSYPHCWRCHNPVIFLATAQWFISMDVAYGGKTLRERSLGAVRDDVQWVPAWGQERIANMLTNRPDWCISRQRSWGVPIPAVSCSSCGEVVLTKALTDRAADVFAEHGADSWYERPLQEFLPDGFTCPKCGGSEVEREANILDVWFDSGSSHEAVLGVRPELRWPADVYLEGSDQYRGWFHSSLLVGLGTRELAPYRTVITHGFVVDEDGKKMSKSLGNTVEPQDVIKQHGAEVLRLWSAMVDYREEVRLSKQILDRVVEAYRKLRNTLRYLLGNLYDFDPATDLVPVERMQEVDRYILARYAEAAGKMRTGYDEYDYVSIVHTVNALATVDLSAFYVDVSKDRLYTFGASSEPRRSGQTAMYLIADGLVRLLAPILPVTADELWRALPGARAESVHLADFPTDAERWRNPALVEEWTALIELRNRVNLALEQERQKKVIGAPLEAHVRLTAGGAAHERLRAHEADLPMLFITSQVSLTHGEDAGTGAGTAADVQVEVGRADGVKCQRCWRYVPSISTEPDLEGLCSRCVEAVAGLVGQSQTRA
jgi:isoleucyl-tRNA synthetase